MEAPPPLGWTGRHAVELYVRTYVTMLQSSGEIRIDSLEQAHIGMNSVLHRLAGEPAVDMGALIYSVRRLPAVMTRCRRVLLGQSAHGFHTVLGEDILGWDRVKAPARRRRYYHDGKDRLAVLIASPSDRRAGVVTGVPFTRVPFLLPRSSRVASPREISTRA